VSDVDLAAMAAEAATDSEATGEFVPPDAGAPVAMVQPDEGLVAICAEIVDAIGAAVTSRAKVAPLSAVEKHDLGRALATVAAQYDLAGLSPRSLAWVSLALAAFGVAAPRIREARANKVPPSPVNVAANEDAPAMVAPPPSPEPVEAH
jgi:hypothetical protein